MRGLVLAAAFALLWSTVNLFHRAADRVQRELDDNEDAQKRSQKEQDGSEIRSVELERLVAEGLTLIERRNSMELFRDLAAIGFALPARTDLITIYDAIASGDFSAAAIALEAIETTEPAVAAAIQKLIADLA